jgi:PAS domain S-box-containing protein
MPPGIQDTLLDLFDQVRQDPNIFPAVPFENWREGSVEWNLLYGYHQMMEQVQQRMQKFIEMEQQLREREEQYRAIFEATIDGLSINDLEDGRVIVANPALCEMFGYTYEEFINLPPTATIHSDTFHVVAEVLQKVQSGTPFQTRFLGMRKDGSVFNAEGRGTPFMYQGKPHLLGSTRDITEQVRAEQELREKEEQYRSVFEATDDGLDIADLDGFFVEANPAYCRMLGYTREELIGMHFSQTTFPEYYPVLKESAEVIESGGQYQTQGLARRKDGSPLPVEAHATPFIYKGKQHMLGVMRDITERVQAEEQLREKEEQYRSIFEASVNGLFIVDLKDGHVVEVNPKACQMWGYTYEEMLGRPLGISDETQQIPIHALEVINAGGQFQMRDITMRKDGTSFHVEVHATPFTYKGQPHLLAIVRDITEQIEAERQLREKEEQYRSIFEATSDGLIISDMNGFVVEANPAACTMHGYSYEEFIGLLPSDIIHPDQLRNFREQALPLIETGGKRHIQGVNLRKDGSEFPIDLHQIVFAYQGKPHILSVMRDITEQVQARQLLEQRVEERTRELSSLLEISHTVASTLNLNPLLGLILDQLKTVIDYTGAAILVVEGEELIVLDNRSPIQEVQFMQFHFPLKNLGSIWETMISRETIIMPDVRDATSLAQAFRIALGELGETTFSYVRACMIVPLALKEEVLGMLVLTSGKEETFTTHHSELALAIANQAAVAIENARLYEQAQALAAIEERQRLARELHDSVSQAIYGISLGVHTARMQLDRNPKDLAESLDYVLELAEAALIEMRALIFELRPESLETEGLVTALTKQAAALQARQDIVVKLELDKEPDLPLKVKQDIYRIVQEALHNTIKHARANQVVLRLEESSNEVIMEIYDDGRGFDASASFPGHLGLHSMRERVTNLGGTLQIESTEGKGTTICIHIPRQGAFRR